METVSPPVLVTVIETVMTWPLSTSAGMEMAADNAPGATTDTVLETDDRYGSEYPSRGSVPVTEAVKRGMPVEVIV